MAKPYERHRSPSWEKSAKQAILKMPAAVEDSVNPVVFQPPLHIKIIWGALKNPGAQAPHKAHSVRISGSRAKH